MTFDNIRNNLKCLERVFDKINDTIQERILSNPVDLAVNLDREEKLLIEIEELKNKLDTRENENNSVLKEEKHKVCPSLEVYEKELKALHKLEIEKIKTQYETTINEYKMKINDLKYNIKNIKEELNTLKGSIRILCRIKPLQNDVSAGFIYSDTSIRIKKERIENKFEFDRVFDPSTNQYEVFKELEDIIESVFNGYKSCLFAYGQTGSGKTYTMMGSRDNPGVLGRSLDKINNLIDEYSMDGWTVKMTVSCIEIYNEDFIDLLGDGKNKEKVIITHLDGKTTLKNCKEVVVEGKELYDVFQDGINKRIIGSTESNNLSSRSHTFITIKINLEKDGEKRQGVLCLIDLAGSERLEKSKSEGKRLKVLLIIR